MYANGTFKNPFTDFDFSKFAGEFKLPTMNVESFVETARKNFAVMTSANTAAVETMKTIAQRQGDMVRAAMEDFSKHGSEVLAAATVEETAIANSKEIADLFGKSQADAFQALSARVAELTEEVKAAIAKK